MKFKIDENLPVEIAVLLRQKGYDATTVIEHLDECLNHRCHRFHRFHRLK
ncbi:MAG TPA: DUF5615 family PIN-like protein [Candidatus Kapabacteria bacterium]|nr:DUF5615 family PIN-like protein [Candidatus Kapabacteria bacterium]